MNQSDNPDTSFNVVCNHEEQYSIWPVQKPTPEGWRTVGMTGSRAECLEYIEEAWTDMRPLSLRKQMAEMATGDGDTTGGPK